MCVFIITNDLIHNLPDELIFSFILIQSKFIEHNIEPEEIKAVEVTEKNEVTAIERVSSPILFTWKVSVKYVDIRILY